MLAIFKTTVALAGLALATAACTAEQRREIAKCQHNAGKQPGEKDKLCNWGQEFVGCVPCSCKDSAEEGIKDRIALVEKAMTDSDLDCKVKCGSGFMLAPGLAALTATVVALKLM